MCIYDIQCSSLVSVFYLICIIALRLTKIRVKMYWILFLKLGIHYSLMKDIGSILNEYHLLYSTPWTI